jgi:predicted metal-dependent RNase
MEETAIMTGHLTSRLLEAELSRMNSIPERVCITHTKPQYFRTIRSELEGLRMKNLRLLRDGETIRI